MLLPILIFILISPLSLALSPLPTPTIPSASPATLPATTAPPLIKRCEGDHCTFGGSEPTLQASVVTTTIMSTTSVPCYITTYITNSETITETIYSTEIITSTMIKEGTVFIIQYSPTPVLMSTPITSVMQITNTWWSYWLTSSGEGYQDTSKGGETIYGGDSNTQTKLGDDGWKSSDNNNGWGNSNTWTGTGTESAWTHITNNNNAVSPTSIAAGAVNNGWGSTGTGTYNSGNWNAANNGFVNWNGGGRRISTGWETKVTLAITLAVVVAWEIIHFFA
ncbi:hypothetical protein I302_101030 [Kwoniella bestiolae CBS 10118]|uniref:Uncharacterized protein n=1 Tax=Kwoniella bestiolae CBS 10118 TaxID=1296100 RepID=A0A1B9G6Q6_9TREE|nr:hypothetical protein I302_04406 [Kwoniella bestiolae CBS 10118]OCF26719.1 hypothetical protein I302_04406 [Kwoniella bestiolae CBS 10118]